MLQNWQVVDLMLAMRLFDLEHEDLTVITHGLCEAGVYFFFPQCLAPNVSSQKYLLNR